VVAGPHSTSRESGTSGKKFWRTLEGDDPQSKLSLACAAMFASVEDMNAKTPRLGRRKRGR